MTQTLNGTAGIDTLTGTDLGAPTNPDGIDIINGLGGDDTLSGLGGNDIIEGGLGADNMDGGAGIDTLSYANATAGVGVALNAFGTYGESLGDTMSGFENLIGSAFNDQLAGDGGVNVVSSGAGDDYIQLSGGADTLDGGAGRDLLDGRVWGSALTIDLATGTATGGVTLSGFELVLGTAFNDTITGNQSIDTDLVGFDGNDILNGLDGNDSLFGDSYAGISANGSDTLNGGNGNDSLDGGALGDILNGGAGTDTAVYGGSSAAVSVNLITGVASGGEAQGDTFNSIENLTGSSFNDTLTGSSGVNVLNGGNGDDALEGGAGADTLNGGAGIDTADYSGSSAAVNVDLAAGSGSGGEAQGDTLSNIENLIGSAFNDTLTGSSAANILSGGNGDDVLQGGAGADTLDGGAGIDTVSYAASSAGVTIDLRLLGPQVSSGDANGDTLTGIEIIRGSVFADIITGDANDNIFTDGGVGAADILTGGAGNDTYSVYNAGTAIVEIGGEGNDRVSAGVNYVLASGASVEYLNTTSLQGTRATNLTGNELAQLVRGNDGGNVIDGGGGNDTLWGMGGADTFLFSSALGSGGVARIGDFNVADDQIQLDSAIFSALDLGGLDASAFKDNASAPRDADDFIIYNSNTGSLFYDADGGGSAFRAVKFASLSAGLNLSAADFLVI
ncbi:calcium-binding protein [Sinorhizobium sp. RAC02]|uniref:beta strand repeat-containing protein n=1 Tax=Sinorhizobium sp. RAC02 TaxID=1842534 RepID=UPI00083CFA24|nr:calcium-binding protein [Sinorhizobium sp. RAC02]AOF90322.1 hemolysin-type calcium-binding repeat family protein [Sinorhizobium sp. RAC02]